MTGVNVCSNFPEYVVLSMATVGLSGGKLFLIVTILLVKYSEKACGMSSESKCNRMYCIHVPGHDPITFSFRSFSFLIGWGVYGPII